MLMMLVFEWLQWAIREDGMKYKYYTFLSVVPRKMIFVQPNSNKQVEVEKSPLLGREDDVL